MGKVQTFLNKYLYNITLGLFFLFFLMISYWSPMAGDDWGYAVGGFNQNPFLLAYEQYFHWAGRILAEFYSFFVAPRKWIWNILNPIMFVSITYLLTKMSSNKKEKVQSLFLVLFLILSVKDNLRMQTYTWLIGGVYVLSTLLLLYCIYVVKKEYIDDKSLQIHQTFYAIISFSLPLMMENAGIGILVMNLLLVIFYFFNHNKRYQKYLLFVVLSGIGVMINLLSPGARFRLESGHSDWLMLSIVDKIIINWPNLLRFTFVENRMLSLILALLLTLFTFSKYQGKLRYLPCILIDGVVMLSSLSLTLQSKLNLSFFSLLYDIENPTSLMVISVVYILFVASIFYRILTLLKNKDRYFALFLFLIAGACNTVMLGSPIFDYRSSIFTVYCFFCLIVFLFYQLEYSNRLMLIIGCLMMMLVLMKVRTYYQKYKAVHLTQQERDMQIQYYKEHPEDLEAYFIRMPIFTVHSADIEDWDTYHQKVFKEYYGLNPDLKLHFYYKQN